VQCCYLSRYSQGWPRIRAPTPELHVHRYTHTVDVRQQSTAIPHFRGNRDASSDLHEKHVVMSSFQVYKQLFWHSINSRKPFYQVSKSVKCNRQLILFVNTLTCPHHLPWVKQDCFKHHWWWKDFFSTDTYIIMADNYAHTKLCRYVSVSVWAPRDGKIVRIKFQ